MKVLVVAAGERIDPARLAPGGDAVLVVGPDSAEVGAAVTELRRAGTRACGFVGEVDPGSPDVAQMAAELFPGWEVLAGPA